MKKMLSLFFIMPLMMLSCSDEVDKDKQYTGYPIIGRWSAQSIDVILTPRNIQKEQEIKGFLINELNKKFIWLNMQYTFLDNGEVYWTDGSVAEFVVPGTYKLHKNIVTIKMEEYQYNLPSQFRFWIEENKMRTSQDIASILPPLSPLFPVVGNVRVVTIYNRVQ